MWRFLVYRLHIEPSELCPNLSAVWRVYYDAQFQEYTSAVLHCFRCDKCNKFLAKNTKTFTCPKCNSCFITGNFSTRQFSEVTSLLNSLNDLNVFIKEESNGSN